MAAPPSFLQSLPPETDATDGDIVTFQVKVSNDPTDPTSVSWWRCGESLRPSPGRREIVEHGDGWHELVLSNITEEDEGEYECRAENHRGHNSCFGSLYYYREGGTGTLTDVTMEGTAQKGDGRQSGLLILIDDGSQTEESESDKSNRKSMTVSEQMQGIIEDLTQSSQGENTGSITLEKDEDQFNSDIEELDDDDLDNQLIQNILGMSGQKTASEDTLVPEMPSPDPVVDVAMSEGASDPYRPSVLPQKWSSNPNNIRRKKKEKKEEAIWPPEASLVTFDLPAADTEVTTSVELPFAKGTSTEEEEAIKSSTRCAGAETPFDVADITEEAVDATSSLREVAEGLLPELPADGVTTERAAAGSASKFVAFRQGSQPHADSPSRIDSLTSVTDISGAAVPWEGCQPQSTSRMSFVKSSVKTFKHTDDGVTSTATSSVTSRVSSTTLDSSSVAVHHASTKMSRTADDLEQEESVSVSYATKKTKMSSAYEADESTVYSESFLTDVPSDHKGIDVYVAIMDFKPMESDEEAVAMKEGQQVEVIDASKPRRWLVRVLPLTGDDTAKEGWVPACYLEKSTAYDTLGSYVVTEADFDPRELEALQNREAIVKELVETEEDFAKDMLFVVENYYKQMDNPRLPKEFRDRKGSIFGNFKDISDFHNNVLMEGIHYHAKEPTKLGKTFLRLERDFDMHANYCWNEARAQQLLREGTLKEYFDDHSRMIDDDKLLADHLKLPIQRLNDYQLLLKELIKYSSRLNEDTADLQKALDFIHGINKRTKDLQFIQSIQGCQGDLLKIGKIIRHEVFDVVEEGQMSERYVFLFKGRLFVTERTFVDGKENYHVTHLFKLQDVEIVDAVEGDTLAILFRSHKKNRPGFPFTLRATSLEQKTNWCRDIATANQAVEDLGELEPSLERPIDLKHKAEELEEPESKKPKVDALKRQDSNKKTGDSVTQPPSEESSKHPPPSRQESVQKKSKSGDSTPQTPTDGDKPPKLLRQESVKKKSKSTEASAPSTPVEEKTAPSLKRQESVGKKKSKSGESSAPQTPSDEVQPPQLLSRQDSKKSKKEEAPPKETAPEEVVSAPAVTRQDSTGKKDKKSEGKVKKQDSVDKKDKPAEKKEKAAEAPDKKRGEDTIPKIIMSEDASGSDARLESMDINNDDNATLASESLRSDDSITPPASGAYAKPSLPLPTVYRHLLILIPVLCAFYVVTEILGVELWN